jgi:DNA-3-methyladenine glycosylase
MFGPPGFAYVYLIYGRYHCFNVVTGNGAAVLIRALEPVKNITERTEGPGLLCQAMLLTKQHNAHDLLSDDLFISPGDMAISHSIIAAPRIGVDWAQVPLRFYIEGNAFVSKLFNNRK